MSFDTTISLGQIVHLLGLVIVIALAWARMEAKIDRMHAEALAKMQETVGPINERLRVMESRVGDLWDWFTNKMERRGT